MIKHEILISCCLCPADFKTTVELPSGWSSVYSGTDNENAFCPDHEVVQKFTDAQCPGCVSGWGECPMWQAFAFGYDRDISNNDFEALERGICPRRTNGSLMISIDEGGADIQEMDLSNACPEGGKAFARAIREYMERYPARD